MKLSQKTIDRIFVLMLLAFLFIFLWNQPVKHTPSSIKQDTLKKDTIDFFDPSPTNPYFPIIF